MYDLYSTTLNCVVLWCFTYIIIPDSDLLQFSTYLNSQRSIQVSQRMLTLNDFSNNISRTLAGITLLKHSKEPF